MFTREERIEVFQDTLDWIEKDPDLSASVRTAKKNTTVFYEDDYPAFDTLGTKAMSVTVSRDRSYQAAMRLSKENPGAKIAVMNFANAFKAGGGVERGAGAQEESLCRTSTLYPLLYRKYLNDTFYQHHKDLNTPKASDSLIYTEGVIICKTDTDLPQRMPKEDWVTVDVITIAAPDLRDKSNKYAPLVDGGTYMSDDELYDCHVNRAKHMLTCAAAKKADILVLGAFGCGAFQNDPEVVARAYRTALQEFPQVFRQIEFAVYCPPFDTRNYDVFKRVLGSGLSKKPNIAKRETLAPVDQIHSFALEYRNLYVSPFVKEIDVAEGFAEKCFALGIKMDTGEAFCSKYGNAAFDSAEGLMAIVDRIDDLEALTSGIFSKYRYITYWSYGQHLMDPRCRSWFIQAFYQLEQITRTNKS